MSLPKHIVDAIETYIPPLEGWSRPDRCCEMAELVIDIKPKVVCEIGVFGGRGTIAQGFALRENSNQGHIYGIDPWKLEYAIEGEWSENQNWWRNNIDLDDIHKRCMHAIWAHNLDQWVTIIRAASQHCFKLFPRIDILTIDGSHTEEASFRDARLYVPNVVSGGYIWADDADWQIKEGDKVIQSTQKAMRYIEESCDLVKQIGNMRLYKKR